MTAAEFVKACYLKAERKNPTFASGSSKWLVLLGIANAKITSWQNEHDWNSLYDPEYSIGTVSATDTFELDDEIRVVSDEPGDTVTITHTDGNVTEYPTVRASELKRYEKSAACAKVARSLVFSKPFVATDKEFGGTITAPVYLYAPLLVNDNDEVPVDDPEWLVTMTAAEYNRGDIVKQNQYPTLVNEANSLMEAMKDANDDVQVEDMKKKNVVYGSTW